MRKVFSSEKRKDLERKVGGDGSVIIMAFKPSKGLAQ